MDRAHPEMNLEKVTIDADFYQQAADLVAIFMVDGKTPEVEQVHRIASMFQSAYDQSCDRGWQQLKIAVIENLFKSSKGRQQDRAWRRRGPHFEEKPDAK